MPLTRGAVTFSRFRMTADAKELPQDLSRTLGRALRTRAFEPIDRTGEEERSAGFVELDTEDGVQFAAGSLFRGDHVVVGYRVDSLKVPASQIKVELQKWVTQFEQENDRPPAKAEKTKARTELRDMLRKRVEPSMKIHELSWNVKTHQVSIWASNRKAVEEVQLAVENLLDVKLEARVPAALAMEAGIPESALSPTPELVGIEKAEVNP